MTTEAKTPTYPGELPEGWSLERGLNYRLLCTSKESGAFYVSSASVHGLGSFEVSTEDWQLLIQAIEWSRVQVQDHRRLGRPTVASGHSIEEAEACSCGGFRIGSMHYSDRGAPIDVEEAQEVTA